jgi:hypothetical protein
MEDIYRCAETGGGTFAAVFPGQLTQAKCRQMVSYLVLNKIAVLLQAGLPEGTRIFRRKRRQSVATTWGGPSPHVPAGRAGPDGRPAAAKAAVGARLEVLVAQGRRLMPRISRGSIDQVQATADMVEVVGHYTELRKAGSTQCSGRTGNVPFPLSRP